MLPKKYSTAIIYNVVATIKVKELLVKPLYMICVSSFESLYTHQILKYIYMGYALDFNGQNHIKVPAKWAI